ncbi:MAG: pentapeptide repeat-containing protein [Hyphomonadaceae bacterium]
MADRASGSGGPPTLSTVASANWDGRKLEREHYSDVLFTDLDMREAQTTGSVFNRCTFRRTRFNSSVHEDTAFLNCTFVGVNFFDVRFVRCKLMGSVFEGCAFEIMQVKDGDWSFAGLARADLCSAQFDGVRLREADLTRTRCKGSALRNCDLSLATLNGADFTSCDLRGSDLGALDPREVVITGAIIDIKQTASIAQALGFDVRAR